MTNQFDEVMAKQSNAALMKILNSNPDDYQPAALEAAKNELEKRNLSANQIVIANKEIEDRNQYDQAKATQPLGLIWKILSFLIPGVLPLILAGAYKSDGYDKKAKDITRFTLYGFAAYAILVLLTVIFIV